MELFVQDASSWKKESIPFYERRFDNLFRGFDSLIVLRNMLILFFFWES